MIMRDPKDVKPTTIISTNTNICKSPFEYMQQQKQMAKLNNSNKVTNGTTNPIENPDIKDLQKFNREQTSTSFKNQFPR